MEASELLFVFGADRDHLNLVQEPLKTGSQFPQLLPPPHPSPHKQLVLDSSDAGFLEPGLTSSVPPQDWPFDDGAPPSNQIVDDWLNLLKLKFREEPGCCVAVHCVAGLGR